jgi:hypothetical protein
MRVRIADGWAVYVEALGEQVSAGEVEVPDDLGRHWCSRGWAHPVKVGLDPKAPVAKKTPPRR